MPTRKKAAAKKAKNKKKPTPPAKGARTAKKARGPQPSPKKKPAPRVVAHASATCREPCRVCGDACVRAGLHEQHRCRDHVGMNM